MLCSKCGAPLKPVIALDIDGTLADYHGAFIDFALKWLDRPLGQITYNGSMDLATYLAISKEEYRHIKLAYRQGGQKRWQKPMYGNPGWLVDQLRDLGYEVWITTTRPYAKFDNTDPDTRWWLQKHGIHFDGLVYGELKIHDLDAIVGRERIAMVVDDLEMNLRHCLNLGIPAYQILTRYNAGARWPGPTVQGYQDIIDIAKRIKELDNGEPSYQEQS
jgi:hypothetical protein